MSLKNDFPKARSYTRMILYSLQHFTALQLHVRTNYYCNNYGVNLNTFCKCKHPPDPHPPPCGGFCCGVGGSISSISSSCSGGGDGDGGSSCNCE